MGKFVFILGHTNSGKTTISGELKIKEVSSHVHSLDKYFYLCRTKASNSIPSSRITKKVIDFAKSNKGTHIIEGSQLILLSHFNEILKLNTNEVQVVFIETSFADSLRYLHSRINKKSIQQYRLSMTFLLIASYLYFKLMKRTLKARLRRKGFEFSVIKSIPQNRMSNVA